MVEMGVVNINKYKLTEEIIAIFALIIDYNKFTSAHKTTIRYIYSCSTYLCPLWI